MEWLNTTLQRFWLGIKDKFAPIVHVHKKADITDFPTSMPASDVSSWAKSTVKPTYTSVEVGLGNVENKSSVTIRGELTKSNVTTALGYTPPTTDTVYTHPTSTAYANGLYKITTNNLGHVISATAVTKSDITALGIPSSDTNTTYSVVTQSANGLMSSDDKTKLDGIATGANNYSLPTATSSTLGGVKTGSNITNTSGVISLTKANVTSALGYTPPTSDTNTTYGVVSTTADGLAPKRTGTVTKFLRDDGTWAVPPDTNTTYSLSSFGITSTATELNYTDGVTSNIQTQLNNKFPLSGGTLTGGLQLPQNGGSWLTGMNDTNMIVGGKYSSTNGSSFHKIIKQETYHGNVFALGGISMSTSDDRFGLYIFKSGRTTNGTDVETEWNAYNGNLHHSSTMDVSGLITATGGVKGNVTGNVSGSSGSCTGNSATATALTSSAGSATQPVYFSNGKPVATTYSLGKSVPSNAVFTDTVYTHPSATAYSSGLYKITTNSLGHVTSATAVTKADITALGIPASDTNTTYGTATTSTNGLMTSAMVTKLNGIATGANAYSLPSATSSVLGGVKVGSNITVSSGTISLTKANITSALGYTPPTTDTNTTYTLSSITGTLAVAKGGTGSTTAVGGRANLGAIGFVSQSSEPSGQNNGDLWLQEE